MSEIKDQDNKKQSEETLTKTLDNSQENNKSIKNKNPLKFKKEDMYEITYDF